MKQLVITTPKGEAIPLGYFVREWRHLLTLPPHAEIDGWQWYPVEVRDVLRDLSRAVHDRINLRAMVGRVAPRAPRHEYQTARWGQTRPTNPAGARLHRRLQRQVAAGLLTIECRWCGTPLPEYQLHHQRFCDDSCRRSYCA